MPEFRQEEVSRMIHFLGLLALSKVEVLTKNLNYVSLHYNFACLKSKLFPLSLPPQVWSYQLLNLP